MNDIKRIGGWSAILYGIAMLVAFALFVPIFTAMPAEAMEPANYTARLAAIDSLAPAQRSAFALGFALETVAVVLMFPVFLALHGEAKKKSEARAALALGMAALGIPFFMLGRSSGFSLLQGSDGFRAAGEVVQAARAAAYANAEQLSLHLERVFYLFFGWSAVLWFGLTRASLFARWVPWVGLGAGLVGVIAAVGGVVVPTLEFLTLLADILLIVWFVGLGVSLLRSGRGR